MQEGVPLQQGWVAPPHTAQTPPVVQTKPPPQGVPTQQGWVAPPHATQFPPLHASVGALQVVPQHGWEGPPHGTQLARLQMKLAVQLLPVQQGWVLAPQLVWQDCDTQTPASQAPPAQQACAAPPHGWQVF